MMGRDPAPRTFRYHRRHRPCRHRLDARCPFLAPYWRAGPPPGAGCVAVTPASRCL